MMPVWIPFPPQTFSSPLMPVISTTYSTCARHSSTIPFFSLASKPSLTSPARHSPHSNPTSMADISLSAKIAANPPVPTSLKMFPKVQFSSPISSSSWSNNPLSWTPLLPLFATSATRSTLTRCVTEIKSWLQINLLRLNRDKSLIKPSHNSPLSLDRLTPPTCLISFTVMLPLLHPQVCQCQPPYSCWPTPATTWGSRNYLHRSSHPLEITTRNCLLLTIILQLLQISNDSKNQPVMNSPLFFIIWSWYCYFCFCCFASAVLFRIFEYLRKRYISPMCHGRIPIRMARFTQGPGEGGSTIIDK